MAGQDFWSDPNTPKPAPKPDLESSKPPSVTPDAPGGFWQGASEQAITKKEEARKPVVPKPPRSPRKILKKAILITAGALLGLILLALVFAPTVAAVYARNTVIGFDGPKGGRLLITGADLSWSGPQLVGPVILVDDQNTEIAKLNVKAETSLFDLALGSRDLGTITLSGNLKLIKDKDGVLNVVTATQNKPVPGSALKPAPAQPAAPITIPSDLAAKLIIKDLRVVYEDQTPGGQNIEVRDLNLKSELRTGKPLALDMGADLLVGSLVPGRIDIKAALDGWSDKNGTVADFASPAGLNALSIDTDIALRDLPMALLDGLAQQKGQLTKAVGDRVSVSLKAKGTLKDATATLQSSAQNLIAKGQVIAKDGLIRVTQPIELGVRAAALAAYTPQDNSAPALVREFPDITINIPTLQLRIPAQGPLDLRGTTLQASINTTRIAGDVTLADQRKAFEVKPLTLALDVQDLAKGVTIKGDTSATIGGAPAGNLNIDIAADGVLDEKGAPIAGLPKALRADISLAGVQTAIAQAFVQSTGLDLSKDVGPTLDARVNATLAASATPGASASAIPDGSIDLSLKSQRINAAGGFTIAASRITTKSPLTITVDSGSAIAARMLTPGASTTSAWSVRQNDAKVTLSLDGVDIALVQSKDAAGATAVGADAPKAKARLLTRLTGWKLIAPSGRAVAINDLTFTSSLVGNGAARTDLSSAFDYDGAPFAINAGFDFLELIGPMTQKGGPVQAAQMKPKGSLTIKGLPTALVAEAQPPAPTDLRKSPTPPSKTDLGALASALAGPRIDVNVSAASAAPINNNPAYTVDAQVNAERLTLTAGATVAPNARADIQPLKLALTLEPQTASDVVRALGQDVSKLPKLAQRSSIQIASQSLSIPLTASGPDFDKAGALAADITIPGALLVSGLTMPDGADSTGRPLVRDLGTVGLQDFKVALRAPGAALGEAGGEATVTLTAQVLDAPRSTIATLSANVKQPLKNGAPSRDGLATARIKDVITAGIDRILNQPGMVSGALGDRLDIDATYPLVAAPQLASSTPAAQREYSSDRLDDPPTATPSKATGSGPAAAPTIAEVTISSPRLRMSRSLHASVSTDAIRLLEPVTFTWNADPVWLSRFTAGAQGDGPRITRPIDLRLNINELAIGQPGPLMPGTFAADISMNVPNVELTDKKGQHVVLKNVQVKANRELAGSVGQKDPTAIGVEIGIASAAVGDTPPTKDILVRALAARLATPAGDFDKNRAQFSVDAQIPSLPTALVDTLANQDGLLEEALGPVIECNAKANKFTISGTEPGTVEASMKSQRAQASLKGNVVAGSFTATQPLQISINEITKALGDRLIKGVPLMGELSKNKELAPASVVGPSLMVPLDNDMTKLNGAVTIDPGELLFKPSKEFAGLLKQLNQNAGGGLIGQKLQPLLINITKGVATYQKWTVPLGEFSVTTEGTVDLVRNEIDILTYLPFGSLSEKGAKLFQGLSALGGSVDAATMVPIRTRGPMNNPSTGPDLELFSKQLLNNKNLESTIKKGLEQLLKKPDPAAPTPTPTPTPAPQPPPMPVP